MSFSQTWQPGVDTSMMVPAIRAFHPHISSVSTANSKLVDSYYFATDHAAAAAAVSVGLALLA
eukprot:1148501-Pelagomonas_calceolata.AAC.2